MRRNISSVIFRLFIIVIISIVIVLIVQFNRGGMDRSVMTNREEEVQYDILEYHPSREPDQESSVQGDDYYLDFRLPAGFYSEKKESFSNEDLHDLYIAHDCLSDYDGDVYINVDLVSIKDDNNIRYTADMIINGHALDDETIYKDTANGREIMYLVRERRTEYNVHIGTLFIVVPLYIDQIESPYFYKIEITEYNRGDKPDINDYKELLMFDYYKNNK